MRYILLCACSVVLLGVGYWFLKGTAPAVVGTVVDSGTLATTTNPVSPSDSTPAPTTNHPTTSKPTKIMTATIHTNRGDFTIEFLPDQAPNTVANFIKLAQSGFYDGTKFHRVIKNFMNQGGDPQSKDDSKQALWGTGGPGYQFADEISARNSNDVGTIAMANSGPNTQGSQFFINTAPNHFLDSKHTVFGKVTAGLDVAMAINGVATDSSDRPVQSVVITNITLK